MESECGVGGLGSKMWNRGVESKVYSRGVESGYGGGVMESKVSSVESGCLGVRSSRIF